MASTFFQKRLDIKTVSQKNSHEEKQLSTQKSMGFLSDALTMPQAKKKLHQNQNDIKNDARGTVVDVGGYGDCGFRAIAAGIMDNLLSNNALSENKKLMATLFVEYDRYFPAHTSHPQDAYERLKQIFAAPSERSQFIIDLAYVLRQMAVDEIVRAMKKKKENVADPDEIDYRGAFIQDNEGTSPEMMRKPTTWIDQCAIVALGYKLNVHIQVKVDEPNKELFKLDMFPPKSQVENKKQPDKVVIQLSSGHYKPVVTRPEAFQMSGLGTMAISTRRSTIEHNDPPIEEILEQIRVHDEKMIATFESYRDELTNLFIDSKLDKSQLLSIYIGGMKGSDYLQGFSRHFDLQRAYFENALSEAKTGIPVNKPTETQDQFVVERLIHAISRAVTIGHLDKDAVYGMLEEHHSVATCSM